MRETERWENRNAIGRKTERRERETRSEKRKKEGVERGKITSRRKREGKKGRREREGRERATLAAKCKCPAFVTSSV